MTKSTIGQELGKSVPKIDLRKEEGSYLCDDDYEGNGSLFVTVDNVKEIIQNTIKEAERRINREKEEFTMSLGLKVGKDYNDGLKKSIRIIKDCFKV